MVTNVTLTLTPSSGTLAARVFENPNIGLKLTLFYDIELPLQPVEYDGEVEHTCVRLEFIQFGLVGWRDLVGQSFTFPRNPTPGYVDSSVYLAGAHNPVDLGTIRFGELNGNALPASIDLQLDFAYEGPEQLGIMAASWSVVLMFDPAQIDAAVTEARLLTNSTA